MKNPEAKHVVPATLTVLLFMACAANAATDDGMENPEISILLLGLVAIGLLAYSYKLRVENIRLKSEVYRYRAARAQNNAGRTQDRYGPANTNGVKNNFDTMEVKEGEGIKERYTKRMYWDRLLSTIDKSSGSGGELAELEKNKKDLQEVIDLTKRKYHQREIDEKGFSELIKEQQKQMIETEAKIIKLKKGGTGNDA